MIKLLVVGGGGHAKVVIDIARCCGGFELTGVLDDRASLLGRMVAGVPVIGTVDQLVELSPGFGGAIVAVGDNRTRRALAGRVVATGLPLTSLIHPRACVAASVRLEPGCVIMAGGVVNCDVVIGDGCIVNTGATIDHDCEIGAWAHVGPGAVLCGNISIGEETLIGAGARIIPGITIGARAVVGAGAVVVRNVSDGEKVVGVPARTIGSG